MRVDKMSEVETMSDRYARKSAAGRTRPIDSGIGDDRMGRSA